MGPTPTQGLQYITKSFMNNSNVSLSKISRMIFILIAKGVTLNTKPCGK